MAYSVFQDIESLTKEHPIENNHQISASISISQEGFTVTATGPGSTEKVISMMGSSSTSSFTVMDMAEANHIASINQKNADAQKKLAETKQITRRSVLEVCWFVVFVLLCFVVFGGSFFLFVNEKTAGGIAFVSAGCTLLAGVGGVGVVSCYKKPHSENGN